jgi:hypothetical protein
LETSSLKEPLDSKKSVVDGGNLCLPSLQFP